MRTLGWLTVVPALVTAAPVQGQMVAVPSGYRIRLAVPLTQKTNGIEGRMELLTDAHVQPDMDDEEAYGLKPALLRLVDRSGHVVQKETLERSRASIDSKPLHPTGQETCLLTVDYSVGAGSYNGPITLFVEVEGGRIRFITAGAKRMAVMQSLKTGWKLVPARNGGKDILEVACRPNNAIAESDDPNRGFDTIYTRYHWNGKQWTRQVRRTKGFWEDDGTFPPLSRFPR